MGGSRFSFYLSYFLFSLIIIGLSRPHKQGNTASFPVVLSDNRMWRHPSSQSGTSPIAFGARLLAGSSVCWHSAYRPGDETEGNIVAETFFLFPRNEKGSERFQKHFVLCSKVACARNNVSSFFGSLRLPTCFLYLSLPTQCRRVVREAAIWRLQDGSRHCRRLQTE